LTLVDKMQLLTMLNEALDYEEVGVLPLLALFTKKLRVSQLDEAVKAEVGERLWKMHVETMEHARMLTKMLKRAVEGDRDEY